MWVRNPPTPFEFCLRQSTSARETKSLLRERSRYRLNSGGGLLRQGPPSPAETTGYFGGWDDPGDASHTVTRAATSKPANASPRVRPSNLRTVNQLHGVWRGRVKGFQPFHQLMPMAARNSTRHKLIWSLLSLSRQSIRICAYRGPHAGRCPSLMLLSSQTAWPFRNHSDGQYDYANAY